MEFFVIKTLVKNHPSLFRLESLLFIRDLLCQALGQATYLYYLGVSHNNSMREVETSAILQIRNPRSREPEHAPHASP